MIINADSITKKYIKLLFKEINFSLKTGQSLSITGPNGSGKSTLLQILAKIQAPTKGSVSFYRNDTLVPDEKIQQYIGFTSPLVNPYDELTAIENIEFINNNENSSSKINELLEYFKIYEHRNMPVKHFSTGMKQRLKLICAFCNEPPVLMLDEPSSNLDDSGKNKLMDYLESKKNDKIIIIATNDREETKFCEEVIQLGNRNH